MANVSRHARARTWRVVTTVVTTLALAALALARVVSYDGSRSDALLMVLGVALFAAVQAGLTLLRADDVHRITYGYLATFYFGNRALAEVWLGPATEAGAGTVAPFMLGDVVLLAIALHRRLAPPAWLFAFALAMLVPAVNLVVDERFVVGSFAYQYLALVRAAAVVAVIGRLLRRDPSSLRRRVAGYLTHLGLIFAALGVLTGSVAVLTGSRFGLPGWGVNVYANALAVVGAVCGWRAIYDGRGRALQVVLLLGCVAGIVGSGTRLSLLILVGALAWSAGAAVVSRRARVFAHLSVGAVAGVVVVGFIGSILMALGSVNPRFSTIGGLEVTQSTGALQVIEAVQRESSVRTRLTLWQASLAMFAERPVAGVGWGQWNWLKSDYGADLDVLLDPHSGFLWALAEGGVVGFAVYLVLFALLVSTRPSMPALALLLAQVLEFTNANLQKPLYAVLVGLLLAFALALDRRGRDADRDGRDDTGGAALPSGTQSGA